MDPLVVLGSALVGLLVGLTGAGGGSLMTPMLVMLFSLKPSTAVSSDLLAGLIMRPVGAAVHLWRGTVNLPLAAWMALGSVPAALAGSYLLHLIDAGRGADRRVQIALGSALLVGAAAMLLRGALDRRAGTLRTGLVAETAVRRVPTVALGAVGGLVVGITSVGSGSLMIVGLMFLYPSLGARQLVGTDLAQAIPLSAAAALGAIAFGQVDLPVTASLVVGAVPGVLAGSALSARVPDRVLRPAISAVLLAAGLKYAGLGA